MIKKTPVLFFCMTLLLSSSIFAYEVQSFNTEIDVYNDGTAKVTNHIVLDSSNIDKAFIIPTYSPESVVVNDGENELKFAVFENSIIIQPQKRIEGYEVNIKYLTNSLTSKNGEEWSFNYLIPAYEKLKISKIGEARSILSFPNTATINGFSDDGVFFTVGNNIKIGWKLDLKKDEDTKIEARYNNKVINGPDIIKIAFYTLLTIILVVIVVFCVKVGYCKITKRISKGKKDIIKTLDDRGKEVISLLLENKNQLYQSKIQKDTSINKATLSRIIKRLEGGNIIEVRPSGNTNLIILQGWFVKK